MLWFQESGTFSDFTKDIPNLKQLGVKVIWLMPIFPISETKRKATGGEFASLIEDETEREKMLGSYYAVTDFTKVNPEFGTLEDFRTLVKTAHENDIYVILDWVPNHTISLRIINIREGPSPSSGYRTLANSVSMSTPLASKVPAPAKDALWMIGCRKRDYRFA